MPDITVILHNIRSTYNVGAIFRTCEGLGVTRIILSGYTPYPRIANDPRLPHISAKLTAQIHKTALGAEELVPFTYMAEPDLDGMKRDGYRLVALEQDATSINLGLYDPPAKIALLLGEEVAGIAPDLLVQCDDIIEIAMHGRKESFNVSIAAGIALYALASDTSA